MRKFILLSILPACILAKIAHADVQVQNFHVTGYSVLHDEEVVATVTPFAAPLQAEAAAKALKKKVREAGAYTAKVYIVPQADGGTELRVIEGRLANGGVVLTASNARLSDETMSGLLEQILQPGTTITSAKTERAILLINDLPGMAGSSSSIVPAELVGEAKFEFTPVAAPLASGHVYYDNFGSTYTGRNRVGGAVEFNSPLKRGDKLVLGANVSDLDTVFVYADASLPVWLPGLRAGLSVDTLNYKTNEADNLHGDSQNISAYLQYAVIRSRKTNLLAELRFGRESMRDKNDTSQVSIRLVNVGSIGLSAEHYDGWGGGGTSKAELQVYVGDLDLSDYAPYEETDAQTAKTAGSFTRASWRLNRLQQISGPWQTFWETSGQVSSKRLDASQGINFGGPMDFAGYHSGEVVGDEGAKLHADLRYNLSVWGGQQQWSLFYDIGRVRTHAAAVVGGFIVPGIEDHDYTMQSLGLGFHQQWKQLKLQAALGVPIKNKIPDELLDGRVKVHGWLQLNYQF